MKRTMKNLKNYNNFKRKSEPINEIFGFNKRRERRWQEESDRQTQKWEDRKQSEEVIVDEMISDNEQLPEFKEIQLMIVNDDFKRVFDESGRRDEFVFVLNDNRLVRIHSGEIGNDYYSFYAYGMEIDDVYLGGLVERDFTNYPEIENLGWISEESFNKFKKIALKSKYLK